jgi:hypothetical protein
MRRRDFIILTGNAAASLPFAAYAQESGRVYRLGVLTGAARAASRMVAFFDELKMLGFVEGQNLKIVAGGFDVRDDQFAEVGLRGAPVAEADRNTITILQQRSDKDTQAGRHCGHANQQGFLQLGAFYSDKWPDAVPEIL